MHRLSITAFVGMLTLTITGCGSGRTENNTSTSSTTVQPTVKPTTPVETATPKTPQNPTQKPIIVVQNPLVPGSSTGGLIQSTNAKQRRQQVQQGRSDPFAGLFTIPKVITSATPKVTTPATPKVVTSATPKVVTSATPQKVPPLPKPSVAPPLPIAKARPVPLPAPIEPPQPDLARGIAVLGVVEVGNEFKAIIKVPTEATSRYVSAGQRLLDGQVLVKKIEMSPGSEPVLILEQNGIEVTRAVGDEPVQPEEKDKTGRPTAAILSSPLSQTNSPSSTAEFNSVLQDSPAALRVPSLPTTSPASKKQLKTIKPSQVLPPPPTSSPLPKLQSNNNLPEFSASAVRDPDFPPPAVRTPSPALKSNSRANSQARIQRQRLILQLLKSSAQPNSLSAAVKSNSRARTYRKQMISRIINRH